MGGVRLGDKFLSLLRTSVHNINPFLAVKHIQADSDSRAQLRQGPSASGRRLSVRHGYFDLPQQVHNLFCTILLASRHLPLLLFQFVSPPLAQFEPGTPHPRTVVQSILNRLRPPLPRRDIQLIDPRRRSRRLQILSQPKRELGVLPRVADKSGLCLGCQGSVSSERKRIKGIVADLWEMYRERGTFVPAFLLSALILPSVGSHPHRQLPSRTAAT